MTRNDRFGLKGDPEIQRARRHFSLPLWLSSPIAVMLVLWGAAVVLGGHHWPRLLGVIGVLAALLGAVAANKARAVPSQPQHLFGTKHFLWFVLSFLISNQGQELDHRLNVGSLLTWDWIRFSTLALLVGGVVWQFLHSKRRA